MCEYKLHCEWGEIRNERFLNEISEYALFTYIQFIYLFLPSGSILLITHNGDFCLQTWTVHQTVYPQISLAPGLLVWITSILLNEKMHNGN